MRIASVEKIEDCFDGSSVYGYAFDAPWDRAAIQRLGELGELDYFPEFPRPFFRLRGPNGLQVKGVEGETTCRAILPRKGKEEAKERFENLFTDGRTEAARPTALSSCS